MAGKDLYIGKMLSSLESNIDDLKTDLSALSLGMSEVVSELINVKEATVQGVVSLNVKSGTGYSQVLNDVVRSVRSSSYQTLMAIVCRASGSFSVVGKFKGESAGYGCFLAYSINDAPDIQIVALTSTVYTSFSVDIVGVNVGDVVKLRGRCTSASYSCSLDVGVLAQYDLVDVVNSGPFLT